MLINGNNSNNTCAIFRIQSMASLSDKDAVRLHESDNYPRSSYLQEDMIPYWVSRSFNLHTKTETMTVLLHAFRCRSPSSVCRAVVHPQKLGKRGVLLLLPSL